MWMLKCLGGLLIAAVMALLLTPVQALLSLVQMPAQLSVVSIRGNIFDGRGVVSLKLNDALHAAKIVWQWCPSAGVTNWCVDIKQTGLQLRGVVSYWAGVLTFNDTKITIAQEYQIPNLAPMVFDVEGDAQVQDLVVDIYGCNTAYIRRANLNINFERAWVFGAPVGQVLVNADIDNNKGEIIVSGDSVDASVSLAENHYALSSRLQPPPSLYNAMSLLLNAHLDQDGVWEFNQQGQMPC